MAEDKVEDSLESRRFGGVSRLYGPELRARFQQATVVVAGLGVVVNFDLAFELVFFE